MDVTNFRDIRKAFGDTSTEEGIDQFAMDLLGDIALDPALWLNPLGFMSRGLSAAQMAKKGYTLERQVINGLRGGVVFRVPIFGKTGYDVMEGIAKLPLPFFDNFKSLNVQFARAMDKTYGLLRTSPVVGPILQKFGAVPIRDPEQAASLKAALIGAREQGDIFVKGLLEKYDRLPDDIKRAVTNSEWGKGIVDIMETGLTTIDNRGRLLDYVRRLPEVMRNNEFRAAYRKDDTLRGLWKTAATGEADEAVKATKQLYEKYDYWLPKKWLDDAGLSPRMGIEVTPEDTMAGALGKALADSRVGPTAMEVDRGISTAIARGAGEIGQDAFRAAQEAKRVERLKGLWKALDDGTIKKESLEELLTVHRDAMDSVATADLASKAINGMLESYFPRTMSPAVRKFLDRQQMAALGKLKFGAGFQFGKQRLLTGMSTTEADAFLMELGSKVTGFEGLGKSVEQFKREFAEHGSWAVLNVLYPKAIVNKLNRIDEEMGSFFLTNPILADTWRIKASGTNQMKTNFFKLAFDPDGPLVLDAAKVSEPIATMGLVGAAKAKGWQLLLVGDKGSLPHVADAGEIITDAVGKDLRARIGIHEHRVSKELDAALADNATTFDERLGGLMEVQKLNGKSALNWNDQTPYAEMTLKRALKAKLGARQKLQAARGELARLGADAGDRAPILKDIDRLTEMIESDKERLAMLSEGPLDWKRIDDWNREVSERVEAVMAGETALSAARKTKKDKMLPYKERVLEAASAFNKAHAEEMSIRAAVKHSIDNLKIARNEVLAGREAAVATELAALKEAFKGVRASIKPEMISNEAKLWYRFRKEGILGWDELSTEAQERLIKRGGAGTLIATNADTLANVKRYFETFTAPDSLRGTMFARVMDPLRRWFVGMTVMHPTMVNTRMADMIGGTLTAAQGGFFSPDRMILAERMSRAIGRGIKNGLTPGEVLGAERFIPKNGGAPMLMADVLAKAQTGGLVGADLLRDAVIGAVQDAALKNRSVGRQLMDWTLGFFGMTKPSTNPVLRLGNKFARYGDDSIRLQTLFSALDQGQGIDDAILTAKQWTYGAGKEMTAFERHGMSRVFPFYSFMSWGMRRMAELWLHKPGTISWLTHLRDNAYAANDLDPADTSRILPKFINDNLGIPVANTAEGPKMYLFGKLFPLGNVFDIVSAVTKIVSGDPDEALRYIGQNMHPALKNAAEVVVNRDFFSGREISQFPGDTHELLGVEMPTPMRHVLKSWFRGLSELDRLNVFNAEEMSVAVDAVRRGDVLGRRKELPLIERFLSSAFGPVPVKGYQIDVEEELRYSRRKDQDRLNKDKALLRKAINEGKEADIGAMQEVVSDQLAEIEARQRIASKFLIDEQQASRRKIRLVR